MQQINGINYEEYHNHVTIYPEPHHTSDEIYVVYCILHEKIKEQCIEPVLVYYRCRDCNEFQNKYRCKPYDILVGNKY